MNAQRQIDVNRVKDYKSLAQELCEVFSPAGKPEIADAIGISEKSIYNMLYGEKTGIYMQKRLTKFLRDTFGLQINKLKGESIKLTPAVNISGNTITKSNVAGRDILGDDRQLAFYKNYINLLEEENKRLKMELELKK